MIVSDAPICDITYDCHSGNFRVVIYHHNIFIIQATGHRRLVHTDGLLFESLLSFQKILDICGSLKGLFLTIDVLNPHFCSQIRTSLCKMPPQTSKKDGQNNHPCHLPEPALLLQITVLLSLSFHECFNVVALAIILFADASSSNIA